MPAGGRKPRWPGVRSGALDGYGWTSLSLHGLVRGQSQAQPCDVWPWIPPFKRSAGTVLRRGWLGPCSCSRHLSNPLHAQTARLSSTSTPAPDTQSLQGLLGPERTRWQHPGSAEGRQQWGSGGRLPSMLERSQPKGPGPVRSCWVQPSEQGGALVSSDRHPLSNPLPA